MLEFSERLKELMEDTNSTQEKLSKIAHCGRGSISTWLNGHYYPSLKNLIRLTEYFNCSIEYLLGRSDYPEIDDLTIVATFTERFAFLKKLRGKSLLKVAEDLKMDNAILYRWGNGTYTPGVPGLITLADYFGCTVDYLIGRVD